FRSFRPAPGLAWLSSLLALTGALTVAQLLSDSHLFLLLFVVVSLTTFVVGVVLAARWTQAQRHAGDDAARLDELEPLPPLPPATNGENRP
ncbi:hypothetical protein, partial [Streptomyces sp. SBT349]|uniref:hypothetical protein n=1 Tax=Streptomyces sp. SBT349 TaxID=1580539 RepID=UPI00066AD2F2